MSARRPRETLGGINVNMSAIPMPSSAMKRSASNSNLAQYSSSSSSYNNANVGGGSSNAPFAHARSLSGSRMSLAPGNSSSNAASRPAQPVFTRSSSAGLAHGNETLGMPPPVSAQRGGAGSSSSALFGGAGGAGGGGASSRKSVMATPARGIGMMMGMSGAGAAGMQTPGGAESMVLGRRSSVFSGRPSVMTMGAGTAGGSSGGPARESFFSTAPVGGGLAAADPRRLRDASVRSQMVNELQEYLQRNNYELETGLGLTSKTMTSPTQKEFAAMFRWLYNRIDPSYRFQKNLDVEIPLLLKQLRYPFERSITRSQIMAVGGNNWHTFLGLLHWLMQLAVMMDAYHTGSYDYATMEAGIDVKSDRIIYRFMTEGYTAWLSVDDSAPDDEADKVVKIFVNRMADDFRDVNKDLVADVDMLEAERKSLEEQIEKLEHEAEYGHKLDEKADVINSDIAKYSAWIDKVELKRARNEDKIATLNDDIARLDADLARAEGEKREYQATLSQQGITIQDLDRMTSELERLETAKAAVLARADEVRARLAERELEASRRLDELDRAVAGYNALAYQIGMIPATAPNAKGQDFELALTTNAAAAEFELSTSQEPALRLLKDANSGYMPYQLLNLDLNNTLRPFIASLRKEMSERQDRALEEHLKNHSLLDRVSEAVDDKQAEVEGLRHKIRAAEEEYDKTKDNTTTQKMHLDAQIERMEKELAKLRQGLTESVQLVEQREINTNLEYEQLTIRAAGLREELHTQVERILNDVIHFKIHIQKKLEDYELFVEEEVTHEVESMEQDRDLAAALAGDVAAPAATDTMQTDGDELAADGEVSLVQ